MICTSLGGKDLRQILDILESGCTDVAEIRLDSCTLSDEDISYLFAQTDVPLIATCRIAVAGEEKCLHTLSLAIEAGARYADLELEAPAPLSRKIQSLCHSCGTQLIRSFHDFDGTPDKGLLEQVVQRCFRYGADIAKIVTAAHDAADCAAVMSLYDTAAEPWKLIAFCMGVVGRDTRLECLRRGSPFTYCALKDTESTAPGQWIAAEMSARLYGEQEGFNRKGIRVPASKSFAQRAIVAAALSEGISHLGGYSPCDDSEAAIRVAQALGARVVKKGDTLEIKGIGPAGKPVGLKSLNTGESGLLTRLMIPVLAAINGEDFRIEGEKTLLRRPLAGAAEIMASFGVLLSGESVPLEVRGSLIPGTADISGKGGSQLISGLLMALPLCDKDSMMRVDEPKSIPYMFITLDVLRRFGVRIGSQMEGDTTLLEQQDWSGCEQISFKVHGGGSYKAADFDIEGDWSSAAAFLVAGAIFGSVEVQGLDVKSLQADLSIIDLLLDAGACVSSLDDGTVAVRKAPLEPFDTDLNNAPDLFPIVSVLAAFCPGESHIGGVKRLSGKESDRASAIIEMLTALGVEASIDADVMTIRGEALSTRLACRRLLQGGSFSSHHDHRMVMALKVASLGAESPVVIDDEQCVGKSFPNFLEIFG